MKGMVKKMIIQIVSLALIAITALIVLINLLMGVLRGLKKTVAALVAVVVSAILAFIVTVILCNPTSALTEYLISLIANVLSEGELQDILGVPAVGVALSYYVAMMLAPFAFAILFVIFAIIHSIVASIVVKRIPPHTKPHPAAHRLGGLGVGLVCGLLVSAITLMPIVGVLGIAVDVGESGALGLDEDDEIAVILEDAANDKVIQVYSATCGWMFDSLASARIEGEKTYLKKDIGIVLAVVGNISALSAETEEFGDEEIAAINSIVDSIDESPLLKSTISGVLSEMAGKWVEGETFLGVEKIDVGELLAPLMDTMLEVISTSNKDNIVEDMRTLTEMLSVFVKHDMLADAEDYQALLTTLGKEGVITELIIVANKNERMSVLSDQITQLSIRALASTIGIPKDANERYDLLMDEVADVLNDSRYMSSTERHAYVREHCSDAFDKYGVEAEGMALDHITDSILADLGDKSGLMGDDVSEFFTIYAIAFQNSSAETGFAGFDNLADHTHSLVINPDGTISVNGRVLKNYNANNYAESSAYTMGKNHEDFGDACTLCSAENMKSSIITMDEILSHLTKYSDCADPDAEAEKISDILATAMDVFGTGTDDLSKTELLEGVGDLLDQMSHTEIFGSTVTADILKAIFQSDSVKGELGLSTKEMNEFADKLNDTANSEESSYKSATEVVSNTIEVVDKINDKNATKEERRETTEKLMANMTPANAELLSTMTTPSMMVQYGSSEDTSEVVSSSVSTLFTNMANFQTEAEDDSEYAKESEAVNAILQLGMDSASADESALFSTEDGEGRTGYTADEYVDLLVGSEVVGKTLMTVVYEDENDDNPFGVYPDDNDNEMLGEALTNYYDNNSEGLSAEEDEVLKLKLNAVAVITNCELPFAN